MEAEWLDRAKVPVVTVRRGFGDSEPTVYTGYTAKVVDGGALAIIELIPGFDVGAAQAKPFGHVITLANGVWECAECEWQDRRA